MRVWISNDRLRGCRAIPILVWHRQNWDILRPFMTLSEPELADIKAAGVYCAGFIDESARDREELYDVLVDGEMQFYQKKSHSNVVNNRTISVASHAKGIGAFPQVI